MAFVSESAKHFPHDDSYTRSNAAQAAAVHGIELQIVKVPDTVRGFVLLPKRWIVLKPSVCNVERSLARCRCATGKTRFRRRIRDDE